jgi:hypothetical protein
MTLVLRAWDEGSRAPNPEIGLWRTDTRNPPLIINAIRVTLWRLFGRFVDYCRDRIGTLYPVLWRQLFERKRRNCCRDRTVRCARILSRPGSIVSHPVSSVPRLSSYAPARSLTASQQERPQQKDQDAICPFGKRRSAR